MALTRELLNALGIEKEKHQAIIDAHSETVEGLKKQAEQYKAEADKLPEVQRQLKEAQAAAKNSGDYAALKKEYDDYKAEIASKETLAAKQRAIEKLAKAKDGASLSDIGVSRAVKYTDYSKVELDDKGELKNAREWVKALQADWSDNIETETVTGANTATPPTTSGTGRKTADEIMAIKDDVERQTAIAQNLDLFGR